MWPGPECHFTVRPVAHAERQATGKYKLINTNSYPLLEIYVNLSAMLGSVIAAVKTLGKGI